MAECPRKPPAFIIMLLKNEKFYIFHLLIYFIVGNK